MAPHRGFGLPGPGLAGFSALLLLLVVPGVSTRDLGRPKVAVRRGKGRIRRRNPKRVESEDENGEKENIIEGL